jgi:hypothetical protein
MTFGGELLFRRQFFLGKHAIHASLGWKCSHLAEGYVVSWHPDLEFHAWSDSRRRLLLLGVWVDPRHPERSSEEILESVFSAGEGFDDAVAATAPLGGRWVLIHQDAAAFRVFHDACGLRQVYHVQLDGETLCASQPELLRSVVGLEVSDDADFNRLVESPRFAREERAMVGRKTPYRDCYHLLPNHYLDVRSGEVRRYFPSAEPSQRDPGDVVEEAGWMLRNSIVAIARRAEVMLPITAGWDSRVLLAASRPVHTKILYYLNRPHFSDQHPDIRVPRRLDQKLGLGFRLNDTETDLPDWFLEALRASVTSARVLPKTNAIYFHYLHNQGRININGNCGEICRRAYGVVPDSADLTDADLARILRYPGDPFVTREMATWRAEIMDSEYARSFDLLDLLHWEQDMGNWGAQYPAEQDLAIEEFSPFNNRALLTTLTSVSHRDRNPPNHPIFRALIESLWAECLSEPINPKTPAEAITGALKGWLPLEAKVQIRRLLGR